MIIDLSRNNGNVDFSKVVAEEIFLRASLGYGDFDKALAVNAHAGILNGKTISFYHFAYPHDGVDPVTDALKQADYFLSVIKPFGIVPAHLAIDLEEFGKGKDTNLSQEDYAKWLQTFLDRVEETIGEKCLIYSYADYLNRHLPDDHTFGSYPLWLANYSDSDNPPLPKGWTTYFMHQYSETGAAAGVTGYVDLSRLNPNSAA